MPNPRLAKRYAKSLIGLAIEQGLLEQVHADMQWLKAVCKSNPDFVNMLRSPIIKADTKKKILEAVTSGNIGTLTTAFNALLVTKGRESFLPEIVTAFQEAYREYKNIQTIRLTTAIPIDASIRHEIMEKVKQEGGYQHIEVEEKVDSDLIGGFVLQIGDKLVDASIAYDLREVARQFENNDFIYKIR